LSEVFINFGVEDPRKMNPGKIEVKGDDASKQLTKVVRDAE